MGHNRTIFMENGKENTEKLRLYTLVFTKYPSESRSNERCVFLHTKKHTKPPLPNQKWYISILSQLAINPEHTQVKNTRHQHGNIKCLTADPTEMNLKVSDNKRGQMQEHISSHFGFAPLNRSELLMWDFPTVSVSMFVTGESRRGTVPRIPTLFLGQSGQLELHD